MKKSQNQEIFSFLLALLGLFTDGNNRFGYPLYTSTGVIPTLIKVRTPFGPSLGVYDIVEGVAPEK